MPNLKEVLPTIEELKPLEDCILWRYTDIPSLVEILTFEYLPLVRVSRLSDQTEGAILKSVLNKLPQATDFGKNFVFDMYQRSNFVSCWCANKEELAPMWERFSPKDGVAIQTNAKRLLESLAPRHRCDIKYVKYINANPDDVLSERTEIGFKEFEEIRQNLYFYKLSDFSDEREVRILRSRSALNSGGMVLAAGVHQHQLEQMRDTYLVQREDIWQVGIASINDFITEIVISPTARPGIFKIVEKLLKSLNVNRRLAGKPELEIEIKESRRKAWF